MLVNGNGSSSSKPASHPKTMSENKTKNIDMHFAVGYRTNSIQFNNNPFTIFSRSISLTRLAKSSLCIFTLSLEILFTIIEFKVQKKVVAIAVSISKNTHKNKNWRNWSYSVWLTSLANWKSGLPKKKFCFSFLSVWCVDHFNIKFNELIDARPSKQKKRPI